MPWPTMMPDDLRRCVDDIIHRRNAEAADVWTELRDWLMKHGVEAPPLPAAVPAEGASGAQRSQ